MRIPHYFRRARCLQSFPGKLANQFVGASAPILRLYASLDPSEREQVWSGRLFLDVGSLWDDQKGWLQEFLGGRHGLEDLAVWMDRQPPGTIVLHARWDSGSSSGAFGAPRLEEKTNFTPEDMKLIWPGQ